VWIPPLTWFPGRSFSESLARTSPWSRHRRPRCAELPSSRPQTTRQDLSTNTRWWRSRERLETQVCWRRCQPSGASRMLTYEQCSSPNTSKPTLNCTRCETRPTSRRPRSPTSCAVSLHPACAHGSPTTWTFSSEASTRSPTSPASTGWTTSHHWPPYHMLPTATHSMLLSHSSIIDYWLSTRYYCLSILDKHHHPDITLHQGIKLLNMCTDELKRRLPIDFKGMTVKAVTKDGIVDIEFDDDKVVKSAWFWGLAL